MITLEELKCESENVDLYRYITLLEIVKEDMQFPEWVWDLDRELLDKLMANKSKIWLYSLKEKLICSMIMIPTTREKIEEFGLRLYEDDVMEYGPMFVHPAYTGNHLQLQMMKKLDEYVPTLGYKYSVCTVHPDNAYAIDNIEKDGFVLKKRKRINVGLRDIYLKEYEKRD